ncbi:MAG: NTP transferase domain-containing protein [Gammaproteobacteria bacterium]|jgi:molybdenum cofactor cytidylyltransferase|nr:NTP transferase domain-containing protein [Gammaproteobacteria bacterium]
MNDQSSTPVVCLCVLAAGTSSRFGATKLVQPYHGKPLVQNALLAAQGACAGRVILVVGHDQDAVSEASNGLFDELIVNRDFQNGIGTSIAAAATACDEDTDALLIILGDQPLVTATHLRHLIDTWSGSDDEIISSSFDGITCPPILFPRKAFAALSRLQGDSGAKSLLENDDFVVSTIDFPPAGFDIDRPEDLHRVPSD